MYHILCFSRIKNIYVEQIKEDLLSSTCYLKDNLKEIMITVTVELPDLEIKKAEGKIKNRGRFEDIKRTVFDGIIGKRIGPGIFRIIKESVKTDESQIQMMLEECCRGIILSFTKEDLLNSPRPEDDEEAIKYYAEMVKKNVRLLNRCAAFSEGSRIIEYAKVHEK